MIYYKMLQISANAMTCYDQNWVLLMQTYSTATDGGMRHQNINQNTSHQAAGQCHQTLQLFS